MGYEVGECHIVAVYLRLVIPRTLYVPLLEHCFISNFKYREKLKSIAIISKSGYALQTRTYRYSFVTL